MKHIKRGAVGTLLIFLLSTVLPAGQIFAEDDRTDNEDYIEIIVRYEETVPDEASLDPRFKNIETMDVLPIQTMSVPVSAVKEVSLQENVRRITYNQEVETSQSTYDVSIDDWNQDMIGTFDAWEDGYTGQNVNVAVLDTGFYQHPEITYAGGYSIFGEDDDPWTNDHSGHGTHVAGILGAEQGTRAQGIAPDIDLYGVKVYHEDNGGKTRVGNLLSGLEWAIQNESDIIVISSGYAEPNNEVHEMIQLAASQGILTIAASGNMTEDNASIDYPAAHPEVIAVSGVNQSQAHVSDSMLASENELAAPGQNILSLSTDGSHVPMSGTSQAVPHVAGVAALLMDKYPNESASAIRQRMTDQALDLGETGRDVIYGYGLVQYAEQIPDETVPEEEPTEEPSEEEPAPGDEGTAGGTDEETPGGNTDNTDDPNESEEGTAPESDNETPVEGETGSEEIDGSQQEDSTEDPAPEETADEDSSETEETAEEEPADNEDTESKEEIDEDEPADSSDDEAPAEDSEETEAPEPQRTVWIRPSETNGVATIAEEDIQAVAENGVLAVSFDASLGHIDRISLSSDQIQTLKEKNVALLVARVDLEWVIPASNLSEGNALLTFEPTRQAVTFEEITKGKILTFGIEQEGQQLASFPSHMTYRFFTPAAEYNQDNLYQWNETDESWELLGDAYTKGGVVGVTTETSTLAVFNPEELASARADAEAEKEAPAVSEPEQPETEPVETEEEDESAFLDGNSSGLPVVLSSVVVVILSVSGGFYFFGGKAK
ncbi:S8 family serine peptidase [Alkalibacterium putridalgicola]|uniref:S8 family serine peptidase n=1 Tax=Alkalibacterium putridalgicola TaxID=426703 RepID=UPI0034CEAC57